MNKILMKALNDYNEVYKIVKNFNGSFLDLYEYFNGYELENDILFLADYGIVHLLIYYDYKSKRPMLHDSIKIWDHQNCEFIKYNGDTEIFVDDIKIPVR
jgi:hypothetical protein